jgi:hypothetical protein
MLGRPLQLYLYSPARGDRVAVAATALLMVKPLCAAAHRARATGRCR